MTVNCTEFLNVPVGSYRPLVCKQIVFTSRTIKNTGKANAAELFFLTKPNTIREHATVDLLYPIPNFIKNALKKTTAGFSRVTSGGFTRVTTDSFIRVTA